MKTQLIDQLQQLSKINLWKEKHRVQLRKWIEYSN